jgi:hypothetical protein
MLNLFKPVIEGVDFILHFPLQEQGQYNLAFNIFSCVVVCFLKQFFVSSILLYTYMYKGNNEPMLIMLKGYLIAVHKTFCTANYQRSDLCAWRGEAVLRFFLCKTVTSERVKPVTIHVHCHSSYHCVLTIEVFFSTSM